MRKKRPSPPLAPIGGQPNPIQEVASALHAETWGKPWKQFEGEISKTEISSDETEISNDKTKISDDGTDSVNDEFPDIADKLKVPDQFTYQYFKGIKLLKKHLHVDPGQEDVLVIREEYKVLRQALEDDLNDVKSVVVTGHPGIGSYESWFSSLELNADFSPIFRQEHLPPLPSFTSSREQTSNGSPIWCPILLHL